MSRLQPYHVTMSERQPCSRPHFSEKRSALASPARSEQPVGPGVTGCLGTLGGCERSDRMPPSMQSLLSHTLSIFAILFRRGIRLRNTYFLSTVAVRHGKACKPNQHSQARDPPTALVGSPSHLRRRCLSFDACSTARTLILLLWARGSRISRRVHRLLVTRWFCWQT